MESKYLSLILILLAFILNATPNNTNGTTIITVGSAGSGCDITTGNTKIQDGIDSNFSAVHIVNSETYNENIVIDDRNISIVGGFATCSDAANGIRLADAKSIINGSTNTQSTIRILGNTLYHTIILKGLEITGGTSNASGGGGILAFSADAEINIEESFIHNNSGRFGGGIALLVANRTNLLVSDTVIKSNQADEGGGVYCNYTGSNIPPQIVFGNNTGVSDNSAVAGPGGGIFLSACEMLFTSGDTDISQDFGINRNTSTTQGGGIYAQNESSINIDGSEDGCGFLCVGDNAKPVTIASNTAQGNGGGVFLTGAFTETSMNMILLYGNTTASNGGGIAVENGAAITINRFQKECWDESHCNFLTGNKSGTTAGLGGLIYNNASTVNLNQSEIAFNQSDFGSVLYGVGSGGVSTLVGNVVRDNGGIRIGSFVYDDKYLFRVAGDSQIDVYHTTIADNLGATAVFGIASNAANTSEIKNSIIHDATTGTLIEPFAGSQSLVDFQNCIIHEVNSLDLPSLPVRSDLLIADPQFVDRANNDYHINSLNSPAIDFAENINSFLADIDFETRGIDNPIINDLFGPYDIGADEAKRPDPIFSDGFED